MSLLIRLILLLSVILSVSGCVKSSDRVDGCINIEGITEGNSDLSLDKLGYEITGIALETSDSVLLNGKSQVVYVSDRDIFVVSNSLVYRFDRSGNFRNIIGRRGDGPGEHSMIVNVSVEKDMVWLYTGNRRLIKWNIDGSESDGVELDAEGWITRAYRVDNGFVAEERRYGDDEAFGIYIDRFDPNGTNIDRRLIYENKNSSDSYQFSPVTYIKGNEMGYYNPFLDDIFIINNDTIIESFGIDMGKRMPDKASLNDMEYREKFRDSFLEILDLKENDEDLFILATMDKKLYGGIFQKVTGKFYSLGEVGLPWMNGGVRLNEKTDCSVWPQFSEKNLFCSLVYPGNLDASSIDFLRELQVNDIPLNEESNPYVVICTKR